MQFSLFTIGECLNKQHGYLEMKRVLAMRIMRTTVDLTKKVLVRLDSIKSTFSNDLKRGPNRTNKIMCSKCVDKIPGCLYGSVGPVTGQVRRLYARGEFLGKE